MNVIYITLAVVITLFTLALLKRNYDVIKFRKNCKEGDGCTFFINEDRERGKILHRVDNYVYVEWYNKIIVFKVKAKRKHKTFKLIKLDDRTWKEVEV